MNEKKKPVELTNIKIFDDLISIGEFAEISIFKKNDPEGKHTYDRLDVECLICGINEVSIFFGINYSLTNFDGTFLDYIYANMVCNVCKLELITEKFKMIPEIVHNNVIKEHEKDIEELRK